MRRVREPRGASHTALALALTSTHRLNNKHARHAAAACPRPPQAVPSANASRPAHISRHPSLTRGRMDQLEHQHGRGASCRPPLRPASTAAAAASSARSCPRLPRRELAAQAAQGGEKQRRALRRLRGSSETSRQLCDRCFCPLLHPWGS